MTATKGRRPVVSLRPAAPEALRHCPFLQCFHTVTTNTQTDVTDPVTERRNSLQSHRISAFPTKDAEALIRAVLDSLLVKAAKAVIDVEPRFMRTRLIELAAMVAQGVSR